jgi:hypothetical protein
MIFLSYQIVPCIVGKNLQWQNVVVDMNICLPKEEDSDCVLSIAILLQYKAL